MLYELVSPQTAQNFRLKELWCWTASFSRVLGRYSSSFQATAVTFKMSPPPAQSSPTLEIEPHYTARRLFSCVQTPSTAPRVRNEVAASYQKEFSRTANGRLTSLFVVQPLESTVAASFSYVLQSERRDIRRGGFTEENEQFSLPYCRTRRGALPDPFSPEARIVEVTTYVCRSKKKLPVCRSNPVSSRHLFTVFLPHLRR